MSNTVYYGGRDMTGSWFNSGFHGHYRNKPRSDFTVPFRQRVKPRPPQKFLDNSRERSNQHLFSRHDNRNCHSDMGDLESFFGMGLGKRKYTRASGPVATQHTKSTHDLITWRGNENDSMVSTYRNHYAKEPAFVSQAANETEPLHVRSNLNLRRRQLRAATAPPSHRNSAPPLLAWGEPDDSFYSKPGVGIRPHTSLARQGPSSSTPFAQTTPARPTTAHNFTVTETITPLQTV